MSSGTARPGAPPRRQIWKAQATTLIAVWLILVVIVIGVGRIITGPLRGSIDPAENDLARWFVRGRSSSLTQLADYGTLLGDTGIVAVLGVLLALGVWLWRRQARPVVFVVTTMVGVTGLYLLTVTVDPRLRPPVRILDPGLDPTHSFPSGHVGASTALYGLVVVLIWTYARRIRWWVAPFVVLLPAFVAVSRLYEGAHHVSDVLTSAVYASAWLLATTAVLLLPPNETPDGRRVWCRLLHGPS